MYIKIGIVFGTILMLSLLSKLTGAHAATASVSTSSHVRALVRDAAKLALQSKQDTNSLIALKHALEAQAYIDAARRFATDDQIGKLANQSTSDVIHGIKKRENAALKHIFKSCPNLQPNTALLHATGWI